MDPGKLAPLEANRIRITPPSVSGAGELYLAACSASRVSGKRFGSRPRRKVPIGDRKFSEPSWPGLVDGLSPERASRLRERP